MKKEYNYKLTENDFIDFQLHYLKANSNINESVKRTIIILIAIYIIIFVSMAIYFRENLFFIIIIAILVSSFSIMQIITYKKRLEKKIIKKIKDYSKTGKLDKIFGDKKLTIYDNKIIFKESSGISEYKKNEIKNIEESSKCLFIYINDISAIIIAKHYLNNEDINLILSLNKII